MSRNQLKTILKINGFTEDASESDIRKVLKNTRYTDQEIEAALVILKNDTDTEAQRFDGLHSVFFSDNRLRPNEIATLLGVDVNIAAPISQRSNSGAFGPKELIIAAVGSVIISLFSVLLYMYIADVGVFHPIAANF